MIVKGFRAMSVWALVLSVLVSSAQAGHLKLLVLTGQSNALGTTNGSEGDVSPGLDAVDARVSFFWHNVANPTTSLGDSGDVFDTLQEQQGGFYPGSATHWGPEINCARTLYRAGVRDLGVIKASRGGGGNINWPKAEGGHMYAHVTSTVAQATADLVSKGHTFEIVGLMYLQGESDSSAEAAVASNRLATLIGNLRTDLPNAANMYAVIGGIAAPGAQRDTVRAQQAGLGAGDPTVTYFSTLDLQGEVTDGLHFNKTAKLAIGTRFAEAFFDAGVFMRDYGRLVFIGDSITQGGHGRPSYRYDVFTQFATNDAAFSFVGSVTGAYDASAVNTPDVNGRAFNNVHDGHWGWRAFWENGRVPLPASRRNRNRGEGGVLNWTGQSSNYAVDTPGNVVSYPDPAASGTGNTGTTYTQDTAVVMIGINDMGDGSGTHQVLSDAALLVDQLQAANPDTMIYLTTITYVGSGHSQYPAFNTRVDDYNALLTQEAPAWSQGDSAVFVIDVTSGFDADAMTYDNVHPNAQGERHVGQRIAAGMGLPVNDDTRESDLIKRTSSWFKHRFSGSDIWNGAAYTNGWTETGSVSESLTNGWLNISHGGPGGAWVEGSLASGDGGATRWDQHNDGDWTVELRLNFNTNANGFMVWLGTGEDTAFIELYVDRTQDWGADVFSVPHNNVDGDFHVWRVAHVSRAAAYHVWRDGERLTPQSGGAYDSSNDDNRLILGDFTSGAFGDGIDVDIDYVRFDHSGAYAPPPASNGITVIVQ